jgi:hypothetical protein
MRKHKWAIIAGVCVVALLTFAGAIYIPRLSRGHSDSPAEGHIVLRPAHWWQAEITEQQLGSLATLWGKDTTAARLLQELWPDVLSQMPQEAATCYEQRKIRWSPETYEEWDRELFCNGKGIPGEEGPTVCCIYVGTHKGEEGTFQIAGDRGFTEDKTYRVSLYTGIGDRP